ncbi:sulfite exporter TauE/SafE family protein [Serratia fonticola]|uniref:sulfite exporter TauE/SafE family protein n=1 Tax=Serratia fonticola TaxID=47917 RepID=UPI003BB5A089
MIAIISVFLLAGIVKGVIGLGLPTISMGLLTVVMPPVSAAGLLIIPSLVTNIWQLFIGPAFLILIKRLWGFIAGIFIGTLFSVLPGLTSTSSWTEAALGIVLIIYGFWGLVAKKLPSPGKSEKWLSPLVGYITGAITAATGVFVIPAVPYLQSLQLNKNDLVQALGLAFTASTVALAIHLSLDNKLEQVDYYLSAIALIPAVIGMYIGQYLRKVFSEVTFRRCFFIGLIALGAYMALK